jgi:phosphate transport system substrate-binding protein
MINGPMIAFLVAVVSLVSTISPAAEIKVGGGGAACSGFFTPAAEPFKSRTRTVLTVIPTTPGLGLIQLDEGIIDLATATVPFDLMVRHAAKRGVTVDPSLFNVVEIGTNKTLVFTHKSNTVRTLSKTQLKKIFTGKVTNWNQVGGANQEIAVVWGTMTPGQNELFTKLMLDGDAITPKRMEVTDYKGIITLIEKLPGAIGIDPEGFVNSSTSNPKIPPITSKVVAVTKGKPSAEVKEVIRFVKEYKKTKADGFSRK